MLAIAAFWVMRICSLHTSRTGSIKIIISVTMLGIAFPRKNWNLSRHLPSVREGFQAICTGIHWKIETKITASHQHKVMLARTMQPSLINRVGKIR